MKTKVFFLALLILFGFSSKGIAQTKVAKFQQFNNFSATFEVPAGKTWIIHQIFSGFAAKTVSNADGTQEGLPVRIFIKTLNGDIKTDYAGNRFGPQVYQSNNTAATISYPIVFPENTKFSLVILQGDFGAFEAFNGTGYISFYEVTND